MTFERGFGPLKFESADCPSNVRSIILPPLHITLVVMKQQVKVINKDREYFKYSTRMFSKLGTEKKQGVLYGTSIRKLINDLNFTSCMTVIEKSAWNVFVWKVLEIKEPSTYWVINAAFEMVLLNRFKKERKKLFERMSYSNSLCVM